MAINDILSVYRQSLASERQTRLAEMQLSLSALQFEAQQQFKVEGRRREDVILALEDATGAATDALSSDASLIANKLSSLTEILEADRFEDTGGFKDPEKLITKLSDDKGKYRFPKSDARSIVSVVEYQNLARMNPELAEAAKNEAVSFGIRVAGDFEAYQRSGFDKEALKRMKFLTAMDKSNVLYLGGRDKFPDPSKIDLSVDPFVGVSQATQALQNIQIEKREFGDQDYSIDRPITTAGLTQQEQGAIDFDALLDEASVSGEINVGRGPAQDALSSLYAEGAETGAIGPINLAAPVDVSDINLGRIDETTNEEVLATLGFLESEDISKVASQLTSISGQITKKKETLAGKMEKRNEMITEVEVAQSKIEDLSKKIRYHHNQGNTAKVRKLMKDQKKLQSVVNTGKSGRELAAFNLAKINPNALISAGYHQDSVTREILSLSQDIAKLNRQRVSLGG